MPMVKYERKRERKEDAHAEATDNRRRRPAL